jgi:CBS domain-containing protein
MQVKDIMIPVVGALEPGSTLRDASEKMKALDLDPMPVAVDGKVVGVVTTRILAESAARAGLAAGSVQVADVMDRALVCCTADESVSEALEHVQTSQGGDVLRRVPVVDGAGRLVGLVDVAGMRAHASGADPGAAGAPADDWEDHMLFDEDQVDFMSEASFPASDPIPPPSALGPNTDEP